MNKIDKYRNRSGIIIGLLLISIALTGCAEGTFHVDIKKDGSADFNYKVGVDRSLIGMLALAGDSLVLDLRRNAEQDGYIVSSYTEGRIIGINLTKSVSSIESSGLALDMFNFATPFSGERYTESVSIEEPIIRIKEGIFTTKYTAKGNVDLTGMDSKIPEQLVQFGAASMSQVNLEFIITLPIKAHRHNADEVKNGGYTLIWSIIPGKNNEIVVEGNVPKVKSIVSFVMFLSIGSVLSIIYYRINKQT